MTGKADLAGTRANLRLGSSRRSIRGLGIILYGLSLTE